MEVSTSVQPVSKENNSESSFSQTRLQKLETALVLLQAYNKDLQTQCLELRQAMMKFEDRVGLIETAKRKAKQRADKQYAAKKRKKEEEKRVDQTLMELRNETAST